MTAAPGTQAFFAQHARLRYELEPFIHDFARFDDWRGKRVLEVGVGMGADTAEFARAGAVVSGVDISSRSIAIARERLVTEQLPAELIATDAEDLPFSSETFDLVWSWGVIHHAPNPERVVAEISRVLRPGGEVRAMLYARRSWFAIAVWARAVARGWLGTPTSAIARSLESPGTRAYTELELRELFATFVDVDVRRWVTPYDRRVAGPLASLAGDRFGWFAGVSGRRL